MPYSISRATNRTRYTFFPQRVHTTFIFISPQSSSQSGNLSKILPQERMFFLNHKNKEMKKFEEISKMKAEKETIKSITTWNMNISLEYLIHLLESHQLLWFDFAGFLKRCRLNLRRDLRDRCLCLYCVLCILCV